MNRNLLTRPVPLLLLLLVFSSACTTSSPSGVSPQATPDKRPELTEEKIRETINDARVRDVPEETNTAPPISWNFDSDEPKEISILDKQIEGDRATTVLDIKTRSAPGARNQRQLSGKIRLHYELKTGWVLRQWTIAEVENISMTYRNEPQKNRNESEKKN